MVSISQGFSAEGLHRTFPSSPRRAPPFPLPPGTLRLTFYLAFAFLTIITAIFLVIPSTCFTLWCSAPLSSIRKLDIVFVSILTMSLFSFEICSWLYCCLIDFFRWSTFAVLLIFTYTVASIVLSNASAKILLFTLYAGVAQDPENNFCIFLFAQSIPFSYFKMVQPVNNNYHKCHNNKTLKIIDASHKLTKHIFGMGEGKIEKCITWFCSYAVIPDYLTQTREQSWKNKYNV